jgi:hypothetical protein
MASVQSLKRQKSSLVKKISLRTGEKDLPAAIESAVSKKWSSPRWRRTKIVHQYADVRFEVFDLSELRRL